MIEENGSPSSQAGVDDDGEARTDAGIARSASRGLVATVVRNAGVLVLQTGGSLVIAHYLAPRSYGVFGLGLTIIGFVRYVGDLGLTYRLEVVRHLSDRDRGECLALGMIVGVLGGLVVSGVWQFLPAVGSGPSGSRLIGPILALTLLFGPPTNVSTVILFRRLRFRTVANASLLSALVLFLSQVPLLLAGLGIWAMVTAYVLGAVVNAVYLVIAAHGLPRPSIPERLLALLRASIPFQAPLMAQAAVAVISSIIVSAILGARGLGYYSWCTTLTSPLMTVVFTVESLAAPGLARMLRFDGSRFLEATDAVLATFGALSATAAGAVVGIVPSAVYYIFGSRWLPATSAVEIAVIGVIPTSLVAAWASITNSQNLPGRRTRASLAAAFCALAFTAPCTLLFGLRGAALVSYVACPVVEMLVMASYTIRQFRMLVIRIGRLAAPLAALSVLLEHAVANAWEFVGADVICGLAAVGLLAVFERPLISTLLRVVR